MWVTSMAFVRGVTARSRAGASPTTDQGWASGLAGMAKASTAEAKASSRRDNYIAQVEFANQEALRLIDAILDNGRRSVIVLHGDEGPWPEPYVGDEHGLGTDAMDVDWDAMPPSKLREKMSTMLAIRSTVGPPKIMPSSPVQIYPAMLAEHFGSRATLPPSEHFLFESDTELYHFEEVTDRLKSP